MKTRPSSTRRTSLLWKALALAAPAAILGGVLIGIPVGVLAGPVIAFAIGTDQSVSATVETRSVRVQVLGTAQDGGLPHTACSGVRCERARSDPSFARSVASLAILHPEESGVFLVDATPDITRQLATLAEYRGAEAGGVDRAPLDGVLLTHAHIGHYLGLAHLGFEVVHTQGVPVHTTPRMADFLRSNGPWSQLVDKGNIVLQRHPPGQTFDLAAGVRITPLAVPHRDEYSDTVGYRIEGPERVVLYLPDTEPWRRWEERFLALLEGVDVALLDGTFFSADELPGRTAESIGHPLVVDTLELLRPRVQRGELTVLITHMNHSNPLLEPESEARRRLEAAGFRVAEDGQVIDLGALPH